MIKLHVHLLLLHPDTPNNANPTLNEKEEALFKDGNANSYYYEYYDDRLQQYQLVPASNLVKEVTNYQYEFDLDNEKRNIFHTKTRISQRCL